MTETGNGGGRRGDLTEAVSTARRGFRRDVAVLIASLDDGDLHVPLAKSLEGVTVGESMELGEELAIVPHLLSSDDGALFCAMFTRAELLEAVEDRFGWQTDEGDLQYCTLPARVAIEMALSVIDGDEVRGLVLNALDETELFLQRHELASIAQSHSVPLVGYVHQIPRREEEETLVGEPDAPPPADLVDTLDRCVGEMPDVESYRLQSTFNAERDLEPHLTLEVRPRRRDADFAAIANRLMAELEGKVPPPGYIDIVFDLDGEN